MAAPPGQTRAAGARWNHSQREGCIGQPCLDVETLVRGACASPDVARLGFSHRKLVRVVRAFIVSDQHERDLVSWVIGYADPTGETAVRNVMRGSS